MACGEGTAIIGCSPREVLEFVLDVERYRLLADRKIGRVHWVRRDGNHGQVKHNGRLLGVATPPIVLAFTLTPWSRLDFEIVTAPWPLDGFQGLFTCEQTAHGTRVVHRECFTLHPWPACLVYCSAPGWPVTPPGGQAHQAAPGTRPRVLSRTTRPAT